MFRLEGIQARTGLPMTMTWVDGQIEGPPYIVDFMRREADEAFKYEEYYGQPTAAWNGKHPFEDEYQAFWLMTEQFETFEIVEGEVHFPPEWPVHNDPKIVY